MFSTDDTIVAIATPPGRGGIGVVRLSGSHARSIVANALTRREPLIPRHATLSKIRLGDLSSSRAGDQVIVTWFPAPGSYTGEDVIEISAHGSPVVLRGIITTLATFGARLARPGEFTLRAFLNGRIDLAQAEAVADLIEAATPRQARIAFDQLDGALSERIAKLDCDLLDLAARLEASLDFPDEGFHFIEPGAIASSIDEVIVHIDAVLRRAARGRLIREGATVAIVGRVNAGKSSLFNALVGQERAIVSDVPGTTRDLVTERVDLDGFEVTFIDTAGLRNADELVEREGVARAVRAGEAADLMLVVIDSAERLTNEDRELLERSSPSRKLIVASKSDLKATWEIEGTLRVSTLLQQGVDELRCAIVRSLMADELLHDPAPIANVRHVSLLRAAQAALSRARAAAVEAAPEEIVLMDLQHARAHLSEVVGIGSSDEILEHIFSRFCVGK